MLLSRFWAILLALALGVAAFTLAVSTQMYNRSGAKAMREVLASDASAVDWYLRDDARKRAAALIQATFEPEIVAGLAKASGEQKVDRDTRVKVQNTLVKVAGEVNRDTKFDALWAVDVNGRVIGAFGIQHNEDWELGGYACVADALHGYIRDDAWVWKGRILRVVARPVEKDAGGEPVGAIVGARYVDDEYANAASKRTGAAVGFYAEGVRVAAGAPADFVKADLDEITRDLKYLEGNKEYQEKGRSEPRVLGDRLGVVYVRMPGEAWELGAGFAVGKAAVSVGGPLDFLSKADNDDKSKVPTIFIVLGILVVAAGGLFLSYLEHNVPLAVFRTEIQRLAKGEIDALQPSKFRGIYKKIASDINDGIDKVAAKGGAPRRAADLEQVLGPIPAQPQMSAFSVPGPGGAGESPTSSGSRPSIPRVPVSERGAPRLRQSGSGPNAPPVAPSQRVSAPAPEPEAVEAFDSRSSAPATPRSGAKPPPPPKRPGAPAPPSAAAAPEAAPPPDDASAAEAFAVPPTAPAAASAPPVPPTVPAAAPAAEDPVGDELEEWRKVYEEFLALKKQCGEPTSAMTFEKFKGTLQRNKDALVQRHNCTRVKFTVYVKDGKAALKASPVK